jgi:arsenite methyltransferase
MVSSQSRSREILSRYLSISVNTRSKIMAQTSNVQIHEVVKERYGAIASGQAESCCGDSGCGCSSPLYDQQLLEGLPVDVTGLSLGCGDPVSIAELKPGETVLDLGSGGGIDCFLAARQVGETGYVIGVDMTPDMLMKANANKVKMGIHNVEFRRGQIEALPVTDNTIDVIMSNCVINLSPDKPAVFREAFRVLKPGGRVSISDIVTEGEFSPELRADAARWAECVTGAIDVNEYTGMMREVGFVDIQVVDKSDAEDIVERKEGMPRLFSARITGYKPL